MFDLYYLSVHPFFVIPAQAGIQSNFVLPTPITLDSRLRGNDERGGGGQSGLKRGHEQWK